MLWSFFITVEFKAKGPDHPEVAIFEGYLAGTLRDRKDLPAAREHLVNALRIHRMTYGHDDPQVATDHHNLSALLKDLKDLNAAEHHAREAARIEGQRDPASPKTAQRKSDLAEVLRAKGDFASALLLAREALQMDQKRADPMILAARAESVAKILHFTGDTAGEHEHRELVINRVREALAKARKSGSPLQIATITNSLGVALRDAGDLAGALVQFEAALALASQALPPQHPRTERMRVNRDDVLKRLDLARSPSVQP